VVAREEGGGWGARAALAARRRWQAARPASVKAVGPTLRAARSRGRRRPQPFAAARTLATGPRSGWRGGPDRGPAQIAPPSDRAAAPPFICVAANASVPLSRVIITLAASTSGGTTQPTLLPRAAAAGGGGGGSTRRRPGAAAELAWRRGRVPSARRRAPACGERGGRPISEWASSTSAEPQRAPCGPPPPQTACTRGRARDATPPSSVSRLCRAASTRALGSRMVSSSLSPPNFDAIPQAVARHSPAGPVTFSTTKEMSYGAWEADERGLHGDLQ
jgi:hypothetical protein